MTTRVAFDINPSARPAHIVHRLGGLVVSGRLRPGARVHIRPTLAFSEYTAALKVGHFPGGAPRIRRDRALPGQHQLTTVAPRTRLQVRLGLTEDELRRAKATLGWVPFTGKFRAGRIISVATEGLYGRRLVALDKWVNFVGETGC